MTISFNQIPQNIRTPGSYIEIDNSRALSGLNQFNTKILVFGQRLSTGKVPAGEFALVSSKDQAVDFFGQGSMLANMFKALKDNGRYIESYAIALDDAGGATAATATITVTGPATANGSIFLYLGGNLVRVPVVLSDTANTIAASIASTVNALADLPVTASVSSAVVTLTFRNKGTIGNGYDMRLNYYGRANGEVTPSGVGLTLTSFSGGATDPTLQTAISKMPADVFDVIVSPYTDATNMTALENELTNRWGPFEMENGQAFVAFNGTLSASSTYGNGRNSQHVICMGTNNSPSPTYEWASAVASAVALSATVDPAAPYNDITLINILPPASADRFSQSERNTLLYDGISTFRVSRAGEVVLDRIITMYQTNTLGAQDPSYLDATTLFTLSYLSRDLRAFMEQSFAGFKIANDGTRIAPGQKITTPRLIAAAIVGRALLWEAAGLVEDIANFQTELLVERNTSDPTRVDYRLPPNLVNPLYILAGQIQFRL